MSPRNKEGELVVALTPGQIAAVAAIALVLLARRRRRRLKGSS